MDIDIDDITSAETTDSNYEKNFRPTVVGSTMLRRMDVVDGIP